MDAAFDRLARRPRRHLCLDHARRNHQGEREEQKRSECVTDQPFKTMRKPGSPDDPIGQKRSRHGGEACAYHYSRHHSLKASNAFEPVLLGSQRDHQTGNGQPFEYVDDSKGRSDLWPKSEQRGRQTAEQREPDRDGKPISAIVRDQSGNENCSPGPDECQPSAKSGPGYRQAGKDKECQRCTNDILCLRIRLKIQKGHWIASIRSTHLHR